MKERNHTRPPLASLACANSDCDWYGQKGRSNLIIRKVYGRDAIRYLRCHCCQQEFSERKNTALWNSKIPEEKAVSVAEHLADGCGIKSTAQLVKVDPSTVRRLNRKVGTQGQQVHEQEVQDVAVTELQADERHGFAGSKAQPAWEAELMDPRSKFKLFNSWLKTHQHIMDKRPSNLAWYFPWTSVCSFMSSVGRHAKHKTRPDVTFSLIGQIF